MLNDFLNPVVLELNDRPSMMVMFSIEKDLKTNLIKDTLKTITTDGSELQHGEPTLWEQILPANPADPFSSTVDKVCSQSCMILRTSAPSKMISRTSSYVSPTFADQ